MFTARVLTGCKGLEENFESIRRPIPIAKTFDGILARTLRFRALEVRLAFSGFLATAIFGGCPPLPASASWCNVPNTPFLHALETKQGLTSLQISSLALTFTACII